MKTKRSGTDGEREREEEDAERRKARREGKELTRSGILKGRRERAIALVPWPRGVLCDRGVGLALLHGSRKGMQRAQTARRGVDGGEGNIGASSWAAAGCLEAVEDGGGLRWEGGELVGAR